MSAIAEQTQDVQEADSSIAEEPEILNLDLEEREEATEQETPEPEAVETAEEESSTEEEAEPESEEQEEESAQEESKEVKPTPKVPLPRLRKEIQKRKAIEQELLEYKTKALANQDSEKAKNPEPKTLERPKLPTMADVGYDEVKHQEAMTRYLDELTDYKLQEREEKLMTESRMKEQQAAAQESENRMQSFFESNSEYQEILQELVDNEEVVQYPTAIARAVQVSEFGPQLDLYLLKNRDTVLTELQSMTPERQLMELGRIQASFESTPAKQKEVTPKLTKAPAPIKQSSGGARSTSDDIELEKIYGKGFVIK